MYQTKVFYICPYVEHILYSNRFIIYLEKLACPLSIHWLLECILLVSPKVDTPSLRALQMGQG